MYLTAMQFRQLCQCIATLLVVFRQYAKGYQYLIGVETRILASQIFYLGFLHRFYQTLWNQFCLVVDACQMLGGIEQKGCRTTE